MIDIDWYVITLRLLCILKKSRRLKIEEDLIVGYLGTKNSELSKQGSYNFTVAYYVLIRSKGDKVDLSHI